MVTVAHIRMPENGMFLCRVPDGLALQPGERCLVEFDYGLDAGMTVELFGINDGTPDDGNKPPAYCAVRKMTPDDERKMKEREPLTEKAKRAFTLSTSREKGHVRILHVRFSYDGERLFIRYSAQMPVDLRRFVNQIQRDFKTRVDLWQVGVRDEAALVGCLGPCGRAVCCNSWQCQFKTVNVRMAKAQEMSLNPVAINGTCGRLKCCLRFEYEQYRAASENLPEHGSCVRCLRHDNEEGVVVARDVMRGQLTVRTEDGRFLTADAASTAVTRPAIHRDDEEDRMHEDSFSERA